MWLTATVADLYLVLSMNRPHLELMRGGRGPNLLKVPIWEIPQWKSFPCIKKGQFPQ